MVNVGGGRQYERGLVSLWTTVPTYTKNCLDSVAFH